ncbi:MAG: 50S ribosomal protein L29 [Coriobacteriales bacterium]|nr:50S ribosomal protein L29 [Coriobacteriales bacterium]
MKPVEIRGLEDAELIQKIKDTRTELFNLRFQLATGQLDNTARINAVKKDIARLHTEFRSRELNAEREAS